MYVMKRSARRRGGFQSFDRSLPSCCRNRSSPELCPTHRTGALAAAYNDFAAAVPRWHRIKNLGSSMEHADPSRSTHFVSRKRQEIATQLAHVDWHVPRALRRIDEREGAHRMRFLAKFGHRINCAQGIRDMSKRKQLHVGCEQRRELIEIDRPII